ncbi:sensor histidine kinase [Microtetraspora fusca]|uniref:histidine kinase n=1 Tax=Microtetraspora fusca TaxID=1997 RepID=A0ABW6VB73_MICFU
MAFTLLGWLVAVCAAAVAIHARRSRIRDLAERNRLMQAERDTATRLAVEQERARIARELHDVVSHNVSVMIIQTGAARRSVHELPEEAIEALRAAETSGREAMNELRHLLGLLASADPHEDLVPQPGLSRLGALVDKIAFAGMPVEMSIEGQPRPLPAGVDLTAYRIVQEALTNALKHAPGGRAEVFVRYTERLLRVEVVNTGPSVLTGTIAPASGNGAGRGLVGLRERVTVLGGDLDARRRLGGGYRVRAKIPLEEPAA